MMRWAGKITARSHCHMMRNVRAGMRECNLEHLFDEYGRQHFEVGKMKPYPSICATGTNPAILHYYDNDKMLKKG